MTVHTSVPPFDAGPRSDRDRRAIDLAGRLLVTAVWLEREMARRLKGPADRRPW